MEYIQYYGGIKLLCPHTYNSVSTAEIYVVYNMVIHNYSAIAHMTKEIYQKYGVCIMVLHNYSACAPTTEYLQWRYMKYILWWYVITPPSHLRQCIYSRDIWSMYCVCKKLLRHFTYERGDVVEI